MSALCLFHHSSRLGGSTLCIGVILIANAFSSNLFQSIFSYMPSLRISLGSMNVQRNLEVSRMGVADSVLTWKTLRLASLHQTVFVSKYKYQSLWAQHSNGAMVDGSSQVQPLDPWTVLVPYRSYQKDSVRPLAPGRDCNPKEKYWWLVTCTTGCTADEFQSKTHSFCMERDGQISSYSDAGSKKIICSRMISQMNLWNGLLLFFPASGLEELQFRIFSVSRHCLQQ